VLLGSSTVNNGILTSIAGLLEEMKGLKFKNKKASSFGSYGWSGESVKIMNESLKNAGFEVVGDGIRALWTPDGEAEKACIEYGKNFISNI